MGVIRNFLGAAFVSILITGEAGAQSSDEASETLQQAENDRALRITRSRDAAALQAAEGAPAQAAQTIVRQADWAAVREEISQTAALDGRRSQGQTTVDATSIFQQMAAPPPGLRAISARNLERANPDEVARVRMPVLVPANAAIRDSARIYGMKNSYAAVAVIDQHARYSLTGTCARVVGGDPKVVAFRKSLAQRTRRLPNTGAYYHISRNGLGVDLSFSKFGCGYVMTIECDNPADDPRCAADTYIMSLAESLLLINPERAGG